MGKAYVVILLVKNNEKALSEVPSQNPWTPRYFAGFLTSVN